ncbi:adenylate cyclase-binding protein [Martiniozyma asiatica (nom. inval.)]|nr:adenylate cyclase-binding protein [Martiniozyma asiatica]
MDKENFSVQGYNLVTLLKRLEAATSRLEDVTLFQEKNVASTNTNNNNNNDKQVSPVSEAAIADASATAATADVKVSFKEPESISIELPKEVQAFDDFIKEYVTPLSDLAKIDPLLAEQTQLLIEAFDLERNVILAALKSKKLELTDSAFQEQIIKPINEKIIAISSIKDANRSSNAFNALNAMAEGVAALGWLCVPTPVSYVPEFKDSAIFWTNRVLKEKEGTWKEWVKGYLSIFDGLKTWCKEWATTGLVFKGNEEFTQVIGTLNSVDIPAPAVTSSGGAPPPPPPPPPPPADLFTSDEPVSDTSSGGMGAVFADLNKGENITKGLKKVEKSQMTHKNPELRKKFVPAPPKKPTSLSSKSPPLTPTTVSKPPKKELVDNKWMILNQKDAGMIVLDVFMDQSVFIGNCENTVIQLKGKLNTVSMNQCTKTGIVVDRAVSSVELNKCTKCEVQVMERVPVMSVDQSESIGIYLTGEEAKEVEIYSSCVTAMNVTVGEKEHPVAEQFKTSIKDGRVVTEVVTASE